MSDRIGVMREGKLVCVASPENMTEERLMELYLGIAQEEICNERQ